MVHPFRQGIDLVRRNPLLKPCKATAEIKASHVCSSGVGGNTEVSAQQPINQLH